MNVYKLNWTTGESNYIIGLEISEAMTDAGYSSGVLGALDYWEQVSELPDELKEHVEIVDDESFDPIYNPKFLEEFKKTGYEVGSITEFKYLNLVFRYQFIEKTPTQFTYKRLS